MYMYVYTYMYKYSILYALKCICYPTLLHVYTCIHHKVHVISLLLTLAASLTAGAGVATQQMKEAIFLQEVRQTAAEERANRLRWYSLPITCMYMYTLIHMYNIHVS